MSLFPKRSRLLLKSALLGVAVLSGIPAFSETIPLAFRPTAAEYSKALDSVVMTSANPNQVHLFSAATRSDTVISLPKPPISLSVSPDGLHAAVMHDSTISYLDLRLASIERTYSYTGSAATLVLSASWLYVFPGYSGSISSINLASGAVTEGNLQHASGGTLAPAVGAIYGTRDGASPNDIERYDVSTGPVTAHTDSPYHGDYPACGHVWISLDGTRIYNGCGTVYAVSANPELDMRYVSAIPDVPYINWLSESAELEQLALIPGSLWPTTVPDNAVWLYGSKYLVPRARFALPDYLVNGFRYQAHGRWAYFDAASKYLLVLSQAEAGSGLLFDFTVERISLAAPSSCGASFPVASATIPAAGSTAIAKVQADANCTYQAISDSSWLEIVSGGYGSGTGSLIFIARPNKTGAARSGVLTISGQEFRVTQQGEAETGALNRLSYPVADAEYTKARDRLILVSSAPAELHIYDPATRSDQSVPLIMPALSVSVEIGGQFAAAGHNGWVSYVNLQTLAVERTYQVPTDVHDIVLAGNGYAYLFPARDWSDIYSLELATGKITAIGGIYAGRVARFDSAAQTIYLGGDFFSTWSIANGPLSRMSVTSGPNSLCGNLWITEDDLRLFTACGGAYRLTGIPGQSPEPNGRLSGLAAATWVDQSAARHMTAAIPKSWLDPLMVDNAVQIYGDAALSPVGSIELPTFQINSTLVTGHGKFVFWNKAGTQLIVLERADDSAQLLSGWGVSSLDPSPTPCQISLNPASTTAQSGYGMGTVAVNANSSCIWSVSSDSPWLYVTSGSVGTGSGTVYFSVNPNPDPVARTGTLTIAGLKFTLVQAPFCQFTVTPSQLYLDASAQSVSLSVTAIPQVCSWSVSLLGGFATVTSAGNGSGNGTVTVSISQNATGYDRAAYLYVANLPITFTQRNTTTVFADLSPGNSAFNSGSVMLEQHITDGCAANPFRFCPEDAITRGQMAVFLVRAALGGDTFSYAQAPYFTDVPAGHQFFRWIQKLKELGITNGCAVGMFCPEGIVTRAEGATFVMRGRYGIDIAYSYPSNPAFADVPVNVHFPAIQKLAQLGIAESCSPVSFCPGSPLTRGQMAIYVVRAMLNRLLPQVTPYVTQITPNSAIPGETAQVSITGANTYFDSTTTVSAGPDIAVSNVVVSSPTSLTARFAVSATAPARPYSVVVVVATYGTELVAPNSFTVRPAN
jgi:hypothetical protein